VIVSYEVARILGLRGIFAERTEDGRGRSFQRGFRIERGERVLIVDDVLTTGGSIRDVIDAVHSQGGEVAGVAVLVDRSGGKVDFGGRFFGCLRLDIPAYQADDCPFCREGLPLKIT
jgi:orotate phosphoribosyltransferase